MAHRTGKRHEGRIAADAPSGAGLAKRSPSPGKRGRATTDPARFGEVVREFGHDAILRGVDARLVGRAVERGLLRRDEVHRLIPPSTLARKVREGRALAREEADQIARLLRVKAYAREVFGDAGTAETWLGEPNPALGGRVPAEFLVTNEGTRAVEAVLRRIDHGDYT